MVLEKDTSGGILGECEGVIENRGPKFGFIATEEHGKVFVLQDELKAYQPGDSVRCTIYIDSKGQLQGKDLTSGSKAGGVKRIGAAIGARAKVLMGGSGGHLGVKKTHLKQKDTSGGILGTCQGVIKNRSLKYGFVNTKRFGEVFVLGDELKAYQPGQTVKFTVYTDSFGQVQGKDLTSGIAGGIVQGGRMVQGGLPARQPARQQITSSIHKDTSGGILGEAIGLIEKRGPKYGFIDSEEHGKVFVLGDELKE